MHCNVFITYRFLRCLVGGALFLHNITRADLVHLYYYPVPVSVLNNKYISINNKISKFKSSINLCWNISIQRSLESICSYQLKTMEYFNILTQTDRPTDLYLLCGRRRLIN